MARSSDLAEMGFPRPGPALKTILIAVAVVGILTAALVRWAPETGTAVFAWLSSGPQSIAKGQVWRLLTAGLLTAPVRGHLIYSVIGLYFLSPDLERRWGSMRFARFLAASTGLGFLLAAVVDLFASRFGIQALYSGKVYGPGPAIVGLAMAWGYENRDARLRLFFFLPVSGRILMWLTVGFCALGLLYLPDTPEQSVAPFGGVLAALAMSGSPSALRRAYLQGRLALLRQRAGNPSAASIVTKEAKKRAVSHLRAVDGGLDEELKKRKPPVDKKYLN
jgi:membrane associated rhomboid family serine protease